MTDPDPADQPNNAVTAYVVPDDITVGAEIAIHVCPGAPDRDVEVELTGEFGAVGVGLTATQAADIASQLTLAAHTVADDTPDDYSPH